MLAEVDTQTIWQLAPNRTRIGLISGAACHGETCWHGHTACVSLTLLKLENKVSNGLVRLVLINNENNWMRLSDELLDKENLMWQQRSQALFLKSGIATLKINK